MKKLIVFFWLLTSVAWAGEIPVSIVCGQRCAEGNYTGYDDCNYLRRQEQRKYEKLVKMEPTETLEFNQTNYKKEAYMKAGDEYQKKADNAQWVNHKKAYAAQALAAYTAAIAERKE